MTELSQTGSRPVPDPTELTDRAIARLEKSITQYIDGQLAIRDERLTAIDMATTLRLQTIDSIPDLIEKNVSHLELLHDEKFRSVDQRFTERDIRAEREARDNKVAVDAAFAAQKEAATKQDEANQKAIDKSELATAEKINKLEQLVTVKTDALSDKIDDVKETANGSVEQKRGATESRTSIYATIGLIVTVGGILIAVVSFALVHLP
jgi:hypothetical protein